MITFDCSEGEGVVIDERICIEVAEISGDEVRLKIDLPEGMLMSLQGELDAVT